MQYWLLKTEPGVYSIDTLKQEKVGRWDGVRNYMARNNLRAMKRGDMVLIYHSSADTIGIAGLASVVTVAYPDPTQFDAKSQYYDPKASQTKPIWSAVDVRFKKKFASVLTLAAIKADPALSSMLVTQRGSRLSVQPVQPAAFGHIIETYGKQSKSRI